MMNLIEAKSDEAVTSAPTKISRKGKISQQPLGGVWGAQRSLQLLFLQEGLMELWGISDEHRSAYGSIILSLSYKEMKENAMG